MGQKTEGVTGGRAPECPGSDKIQVSSLPSHCFLLQKKELVTPSLRTKWGAWATTTGTQGLQLPPAPEAGAAWKKAALQSGLLPEARALASCWTHGLAGALHWGCRCSGTERDTYDFAHSKRERCQWVHSWGLAPGPFPLERKNRSQPLPSKRIVNHPCKIQPDTSAGGLNLCPTPSTGAFQGQWASKISHKPWQNYPL